MQSFRGQPKREYLKEIRQGRIGSHVSRVGMSLRAAGRVLGAIGKEVMHPGSSLVHERMKKYGKWYSSLGRKWSAQPERVKKLLYGKKGKLSSPSEDFPIIEEIIDQLAAPRQGRPNQKGITREELLEDWRPRLEKKIGERKTAEFLRALRLEKGIDPKFSGFPPKVEVSFEKTQQMLLRAKNIRPKDMLLAKVMLEGMRSSPPEAPHRKGFTHEKAAEGEQVVEKILGKQGGAVWREALGVQALPGGDSKASSVVQPRTVGIREGLFGWGSKRSDNND